VFGVGYIRYMRKEEQKNPIDLELKKERAELPVKFIYVEHVPENIDRIVEAVGDADIVAIEYPGKSKGDKEHMQKLHAEGSLSDKIKQPSFLGSLSAKLEGKEIKLIDVSREDAVWYRHVAEAFGAEGELVSTLKQSFENKNSKQMLPQILEKLEHFIRLDAKAVKMREEMVIEQLSDILKENTNKKVAVIQGAIHTPVYHKLSRDNVALTRDFVLTDDLASKSERVLMHMPFYGQILRRTRIYPDKPISESELKRALIEFLYVEFKEKELGEARDILEKIAESELDSELENLFDQLQKNRIDIK